MSDEETGYRGEPCADEGRDPRDDVAAQLKAEVDKYEAAVQWLIHLAKKAPSWERAFAHRKVLESRVRYEQVRRKLEAFLRQREDEKKTDPPK